MTAVFLICVVLVSFRKHQYIILSIVLFGIFAICGFFLRSSSRESVGQKVAVIDSVLMKKSATCFQSHEKTEKMLNDVVNSVREFDKNIKIEYAKMQSDKSISEKQRKKNIASFESRCAEASRKYQLEMQKVRDIDQKLSDYLNDCLYKIIKNIARSEKVDIVLNNEAKGALVVFYSAKKVDITSKVVNQLNALVPDVDLSSLK